MASPMFNRNRTMEYKLFHNHFVRLCSNSNTLYDKIEIAKIKLFYVFNIFHFHQTFSKLSRDPVHQECKKFQNI